LGEIDGPARFPEGFKENTKFVSLLGGRTDTILKSKINKDSSTSASPPLRMTPLRQKLVILSAAKDLPISI
jgi:hypothetical protein